jgi:mono/diheme cytochrome c family protein
MVTGKTVLVGALVLMACFGQAQDKPTPVVPPDVASGKQTYMEHCTACHGEDGRGTGPASSVLKVPPPDLRRLAMRHNDKFPEEYVTRVVRFGSPFSAHGSSDMPVWGPIFSVLENGNEVGVRRRIKNLCAYLASIQDKES